MWERKMPSAKLANKLGVLALRSRKTETQELTVLPGDGTQELTVPRGDAELFACQCNMKCCALPATAGTLTAAQRGDAPFFIITCRNFTTTLELGRISTWRLPRFSALYMLLRASPSTLIRTMLRRRLKRAGAARLAAAVACALSH